MNLAKQAFDFENALHINICMAESEFLMENYEKANEHCEVVLAMNEKLNDPKLNSQALRIS